jgi:hypothetical protein
MKPLLLLLLAASGRVHETRHDLKTPQEIQGYPCAAGYAWFFDDGTLSSCFVSRQTSFGELTIPPKAWIQLTAEGRPWYVFLGQNVTIKGYPARGQGHDFSTALYPSGKLKTLWLAADTVIDGVPCMEAGFFADVFGGGVETDFHENGKLERCKLARDITIQGRAFHRGDHIRLDNNGKLTGPRL